MPAGQQTPARDLDNVFAEDGGEHQIGTITGTTAGGLTVDLSVAVRTA